jgi:nitroreductase
VLGSAGRFVRIVLAHLREARAVYCGQRMYRALQLEGADNHFALRRNIHRLEKALISRPRRSVFALDYIGETVKMFTSEVAGAEPQDGDAHLRWARDVLDNYFEVMDPDPAADAARREFERVRDRISESGNGRFAPFPRGDSADELPSFQQVLALARRRRSVRWFKPLPVPRRLVEQAVEVAALSPSACNRQPFEFRVFDDPLMVRSVAELAAGTKGFNENFPAIAAVVGRLRAYFHEKDRHLIYIDGSLAAMSFLFALETLGLGSCCINWPDMPRRDEKMRELLGLADDERVVMLIAFGYADPDGYVPYSGKRSIRQLASFNVVAK